MTANIIILRTRNKISSMHSREAALRLLIPQIIGLLWDRGMSTRSQCAGLATVRIETGLEIGGYHVAPGAFGLHTYFEAVNSPISKVFSAHLFDPAFKITPGRYLDGKCDILSWRRGNWEERVMAEQTNPRTVAHVLTAGLTRQGI